MPRWIAIALLLGCTAVRTRNLCEADGMEHIGAGEMPRDCHRCESDADCGFTGNVCTGEVFCAHHDAEVVSIDIGCSPEPSMPDESGCICRDGHCQVH